MDYEHDNLNTPGITTIVNHENQLFLLGIIRKDSIYVLDINLEPGTARYIATYRYDPLYPSLLDENLIYLMLLKGVNTF